MKRAFFVLLGVMMFAGAVSAADPLWRYQENAEEYDTMTIESYNTALALANQRETVAKEGIAEEQAKIESLKQQIESVTQEIAAVIQEKYDILGITEQDVIDAENEIASIRDELNLLLGMTSDELVQHMDDIKKLEARIAALKEKPVSYLWKIRDQIAELDDLLASVKANLPDKLMSYTVKLVPGRRECLWRISEYDEIYSDPTEWPKLYRGNRSLIDNYYNVYSNSTDDPKYSRPEDLIRVGWELDIPR